MRTRKEIMEDTYKQHLTTVEVLLDIREELSKARGLQYLTAAKGLSEKEWRDLGQRVSEEIKRRI